MVCARQKFDEKKAEIDALTMRSIPERGTVPTIIELWTVYELAPPARSGV